MCISVSRRAGAPSASMRVAVLGALLSLLAGCMMKRCHAQGFGIALASGSNIQSEEDIPVQNTNVWKTYLLCNPDATLDDPGHKGWPRSNRRTVTLDQDLNMECADVMTAEFLNRYVVILNGPRTGPATVEGSSPVYRVLGERCDSKRSCSTCCYSRIKSKCVFGIYPGNQLIIAIKGRCSICPQTNCPRTCPNGKFAMDYTYINPVIPPRSLALFFL